MTFDELAKTRRSIRRYLPKDVPEELTERLLEAARWAPSAGNCQPVRIYAVKSASVRKALAEKAYPAAWFAAAPLVLVVCVDAGVTGAHYRARGTDLYCLQDSGAAVQNILLCAQSHGLASCWVGAFNEDACREVLGCPQNHRPVAMLPVGYADEAPPPRERKPLSELVTYLYDEGRKS